MRQANGSPPGIRDEIGRTRSAALTILVFSAWRHASPRSLSSLPGTSFDQRLLRVESARSGIITNTLY
jgi:hypothetical protein